MSKKQNGWTPSEYSYPYRANDAAIRAINLYREQEAKRTGTKPPSINDSINALVIKGQQCLEEAK